MRVCFLVNAATLNGKKVVTSDDNLLGEIEGIEVDTENWTITHLRVILTKQSAEELNPEKPILWDVVLTLPVKLIKAFGETVNLGASFSEIATLVKSK